jgi:hypothetical protein
MCKSPEDATLLLSSLWVLGGSSIMLKWWRIAFNPTKDHFQFWHLWVLLPGLPLHLWNEGALRAISDSLGKFIALDTKLLTTPVRKMGRVLVEMDIYCGLPESIEIEWRGRRIAQSLDYLGLPFCCNKCRKTRHLHRDCIGKDEDDTSEDSELQRNPPEYMEEDLSMGNENFITGDSPSHQREEETTLLVS